MPLIVDYKKLHPGFHFPDTILRLSRVPLPSHLSAPTSSMPSSALLTTLSLSAQIALLANAENASEISAAIPSPSDSQASGTTKGHHCSLATNTLAAGYDRVVIITDKPPSADQTKLYLSSPFSPSSSSSPPTLPPPTYMTLPYRVDSVSCGSTHVLALACGGSVLLAWGSDKFGQLGIGGGGNNYYESNSAAYVENPTPVVRAEDG